MGRTTSKVNEVGKWTRKATNQKKKKEGKEKEEVQRWFSFLKLQESQELGGEEESLGAVNPQKCTTEMHGGFGQKPLWANHNQALDQNYRNEEKTKKREHTFTNAESLKWK